MLNRDGSPLEQEISDKWSMLLDELEELRKKVLSACDEDTVTFFIEVEKNIKDGRSSAQTCYHHALEQIDRASHPATKEVLERDALMRYRLEFSKAHFGLLTIKSLISMRGPRR